MATTGYSMGHADPGVDIWAELHARLRVFVGRRIPDASAVDDLALEIMLRVYSQIGRLRRRDRLDAWAYQVARNAIADYWRGRAASRELPLDDELSERLTSLPERENEDEAEERHAEIVRCLAPMVGQLREPYREAIRLTDLGGDTQAAAAARLAISVPGMKARVQRGRAQLREKLAACCRIELDRRRRITGFEPNGGRSCDCRRPA